MATVVFVHGTGVREPAYRGTLQRIEEEVHKIRSDLIIAPCLWGDSLGAKLYAKGLSIPLYDSTLGPGAVEEDAYEVALWRMLYQDPLYELRVLSLGAMEAADFIPGKETPGEYLDQKVCSMIPSPTLQATLTQAGIHQVFDEARQAIVDSAPYRDALRKAPQELSPYRAAIARAIVATAMAQCEQQQQYPTILTDAALRNEVAKSLGSELGDADLSIGGWVAKQLFGLALKLGVMNHVQRRRGAITDATYPFAGDVLLYQARGGAIRDFIRDCILQAEPPVVLLGHSLGGIACVDLLVMQSLPQVVLLVTVGSQASFLYEINALHSLSYGEPLPLHFPQQWLNIYDLRDLLSYVGATLFDARVQDVLVDSRQPFPRAHSAYWDNPTTWKAIRQALNRRLP
jgi:hypothetical protein